ncbi:hypothetical protein ACQ4PT_001142 [Festuca glaucescens]
MANFEFDPAPWVPTGFHIIDGGPNRLPRTFVTPSAPMVDAHEGWAVAVVDPPPPEHLLQDAMDQVSNFLLERDLEIVNSLPWFCGVGAFQFRNPVVRAALVDHGEWPLGDASLRFIKHNEGVGFRTQHGARTGWLMFIGTPMDFRNTETIAEAINTFGEFHYWQHRDIQKCRILVYATFPSPSQVPRDVVFRQPKVARYSGLRHSWTAPVYILSAEMADVHPADEDPMPLDGNPHPLPGNLQPNNLNFVLPEYPEVGWNVPPMEMDPPGQNVAQPMQQGGDAMWEHHIDNSDVLSALSSASVAPPMPNVMDADDLVHPVEAQAADGVGHQALQLDDLVAVLQPPDEVIVAAVGEQIAHQILVEEPAVVAGEAVDYVLAEAEGNVDQMLVAPGEHVELDVADMGNNIQGVAAEEADQAFYAAGVEGDVTEVAELNVDIADNVTVEVVAHGVAVQESQAGMPDVAMEEVLHHVVHVVAVLASQDQALKVSSDVAGAIVPYMAKRSWDQAFNTAPVEHFAVASEMDQCHRSKVPIKLSALKIIDNLHTPSTQAGSSEPLQFSAVELQDANSGVKKNQSMPTVSGPFVVGTSVDAVKQKIQRRKKTLVVITGPRRFTRSQLLLDGHRAPPVPGLSPRPRKKSKKGSVHVPLSQTGVADVTPPTPLPVLQKISAMLDIDPALLTPEKLMASLDSDDAAKGVNDN